jgi:uncharacterized protein (TIGR02646 family)
MIRIAKSPAIPKPLNGATSSGGKATQKLIDAVVAGNPLPDFRSDVYGHDLVRERLFLDQHNKCAFCESPVKATMYGDVEHFRPKGGWIQKDGDQLNQPGYYWLAYDWSNLLISCQLCNQEFKKNRFPLLNPTRRAKSHKHDIGREKPYLVNPCNEDPSGFISFNESIPIGIDAEGRGAETIRILGLDREAMNGERLTRLSELKLKLRAIQVIEEMESPDVPLLQLLDEFKREVDAWVAKTSPYAAMCRCAIQDSAG